MKGARLLHFGLIVILGLPQYGHAIGTVLGDGEMFSSDGVVCGYVNGSWVPGTMKGDKFISHNDKKKAFAKKAKKASGTQLASLLKKKKKFAKLHKSELATCADGDPGQGGSDQAVTRGQQYYSTSCALSGCHATDSPSKYAGSSAETILSAFQTVNEMKQMTPPQGSDLTDLVAYLGSL